MNLRAHYEQTRTSIVEGSRHVLHFAAAGSMKTLHHISTNSVLTGGEGVHPEQSVEGDSGEGLLDGYSRAKWVAERLVERASAEGLPVTIYRPGNIGPHRQTGYHNPSDLLTLLLSACARLKLAPAHTGGCFGLTMSRENALTKRPGITGAAQIFV